MEFAPSERVATLLDRVREFTRQHVDPVEGEALEALDREVEPGTAYPAILVDLRERARSEGLWNLFMPDDRYGPGLLNWEYGMLCEEMGRSGVAPMVFNCAAPDTGNMEILAEHGTDEQKERWLQPLLDGETRSCFSMTEPETAGSDPTGLMTRAELDGDDWVINGHKWFTSGYNGAGVAIAMVVTDPRRAAAQARLDDPRAGRHARLHGRPPGAGDGPRRGSRSLGGALRGLPRACRQPAGHARLRVRDRPGPARTGPHPPLHAGDRLGRARASS